MILLDCCVLNESQIKNNNKFQFSDVKGNEDNEKNTICNLGTMG